MAKQQVSGPYRVQPLGGGKFELMEMEKKQLEPLRPRKVYDKRPSAYQEMVRMNRRWAGQWAREEAEYYWGKHQEEHLREQNLEEVATRETLVFKHIVEEEDGVQMNEDAMACFRKEWIAVYKKMEEIDSDMKEHPEDYDLEEIEAYQEFLEAWRKD